MEKESKKLKFVPMSHFYCGNFNKELDELVASGPFKSCFGIILKNIVEKDSKKETSAHGLMHLNTVSIAHSSVEKVFKSQLDKFIKSFVQQGGKFDNTLSFQIIGSEEGLREQILPYMKKVIQNYLQEKNFINKEIEIKTPNVYRSKNEIEDSIGIHFKYDKNGSKWDKISEKNKPLMVKSLDNFFEQGFVPNEIFENWEDENKEVKLFSELRVKPNKTEEDLKTLSNIKDLRSDLKK